ncbi:hypothetical protein DCS_03560 [Drechmeria coniospora]|uniref:Uncharacterized protein n=1 Tax=Drechmeria coniospora TaxID=98403 RepID=A0A151GHK4_DRECN|nr:hypothetical protein DCS_03560 [Drechmeria coniospora]KYK56560.1 hypothetical protein DCS_03560 [Drechmeria coniospora]ODA76998.1 hypothetical protein RJ55_07515 [Drechmeria coniospora]
MRGEETDGSKFQHRLDRPLLPPVRFGMDTPPNSALHQKPDDGEIPMGASPTPIPGASKTLDASFSCQTWSESSAVLEIFVMTREAVLTMPRSP